MRDRFATALVGAGHKARDGEERALSCWPTSAPTWREMDLLVLDLRLPHAGGVELVRAIRKIDGGRLPILVFSGTIASAAEVKDLAASGSRAT